MSAVTSPPIEPLTARQRRIFLVLAVVVAVSRFAALAKGPWDWDEVLFCNAVGGDYDVAEHRPHPLGFPLFVLLGRIVRLVAASDFRALQAVSLVAGMLAFPVLFAAARSFRLGFRQSIAAGVLFAFFPNVWFYGGTALSDLTGGVIFLGAVAAYLRRPGDTRLYLVASLLLGAAILIRPQNALVAVFPWLVATIALLRQRRFRTILAGALIVAVIAASGYAVAVLATGLDAYVTAVRVQSEYARQTAPPDPWGVTTLDRLPLHFDPFHAGNVMTFVCVFALMGLLAGRRTGLAVFLTFAPYFVFVLIALNDQFVSRFAINYMGGMALLAVIGIDAIARAVPRARTAIQAVAFLAILFRFVTWTFPAFTEPRKRVPAPVEAALWLRANTSPSNTVFGDGSSWPWVSYYLADRKLVKIDDDTELVNHPDARHGWYMTNMDTPSRRDARFFHRPRDRSFNIVTPRLFESTVQQASTVIAFGKGWHEPESAGKLDRIVWRWAAKSSELHLPREGAPHELRLRIEVPLHVLPKPVLIRFSVDGKEIGRVSASEPDQKLRFVVTPREDVASILRIETSDAFVPAQLGESGDTRELAFRLTEWEWTPAAPMQRPAPSP